MAPEKYFYLNQGGGCSVDGKNDREDFEATQSAMQVLGFTSEEQETLLKMLSSILHLGNVYFHRKQLRGGSVGHGGGSPSGGEGVEIGSDVEVKWTAHLLQLGVQGISRALVSRTRVIASEAVSAPLNIDQALDARDAVAKALYGSLFAWVVARVNKVCAPQDRRKDHQRQHHHHHHRRRGSSGSKVAGDKNVIAILDMFGFEVRLYCIPMYRTFFNMSCISTGLPREQLRAALH